MKLYHHCCVNAINSKVKSKLKSKYRSHYSCNKHVILAIRILARFMATCQNKATCVHRCLNINNGNMVDMIDGGHHQGQRQGQIISFEYMIATGFRRPQPITIFTHHLHAPYGMHHRLYPVNFLSAALAHICKQ